MTAPRLFTIPETALQLGVSRNTIYRLISAGELRVVDVGIGRTKTRVREDDIRDYIDRHTAAPLRQAVSAT